MQAEGQESPTSPGKNSREPCTLSFLRSPLCESCKRGDGRSIATLLRCAASRRDGSGKEKRDEEADDDDRARPRSRRPRVGGRRPELRGRRLEQGRDDLAQRGGGPRRRR